MGGFPPGAFGGRTVRDPSLSYVEAAQAAYREAVERNRTASADGEPAPALAETPLYDVEAGAALMRAGRIAPGFQRAIGAFTPSKPEKDD